MAKRGLGLGASTGVAAALAVCIAAAAAAGEVHGSTRLAGNVIRVDADKGEFTIIDAGRRHILTFDAETVVRQGSNDRSVSDLHKGDRVVVTVADDDADRARLIAIAGPSALSRPGSPAAGAPAFAPALDARNLPR